MALVQVYPLSQGNDSSGAPLAASSSTIKILVVDGPTLSSYGSPDLISYLQGKSNTQVTTETLAPGGSLTNDPSQYDVVFVLELDGNLTTADKSKFQQLINRGGRIIGLGEHSGFPNQNAAISDLSAFLGGSITITSTNDTGASYNNGGGVINLANNDVLDGVTEWKTAASATLEVDDSNTTVLIVDDVNRILVADQRLSNGRLTVWADIDAIVGNDFTASNKI